MQPMMSHDSNGEYSLRNSMTGPLNFKTDDAVEDHQWL